MRAHDARRITAARAGHRTHQERDLRGQRHFLSPPVPDCRKEEPLSAPFSSLAGAGPQAAYHRVVIGHRQTAKRGGESTASCFRLKPHEFQWYRTGTAGFRQTAMESVRRPAAQSGTKDRRQRPRALSRKSHLAAAAWKKGRHVNPLSASARITLGFNRSALPWNVQNSHSDNTLGDRPR